MSVIFFLAPNIVQIESHVDNAPCVEFGFLTRRDLAW